MMSTKMKNRLENGVWIYEGEDIIVCAFENRAWEPGQKRFGMSWHKGEMPAYMGKEFETIEDLFSEMRKIADLRYWKDSE